MSESKQRPGIRNFDYETAEVLQSLQADIEYFAANRDHIDLVDALEGIREILVRLVEVHPRIDDRRTR